MEKHKIKNIKKSIYYEYIISNKYDFNFHLISIDSDDFNCIIPCTYQINYAQSNNSYNEKGHICFYNEKYNYSLDFIVGFTRNNIKYNKNIKLDSKLIGKNLKAIRENLKLTQQQIADKCNIYQSTYNHYETIFNDVDWVAACGGFHAGCSSTGYS